MYQQIIDISKNYSLADIDCSYHLSDADGPAKALSEKVRVLIWVMTSPENLERRARHIQRTWGRRVDSLLFISSEADEDFPAVRMRVPEGRDHLTAKTMRAFRYSADI